MSSKDVPEKGLMEGEPGTLFLATDPFPARGKNEEPSLNLELYLDEPQFDELFANLIANCDKIEKSTMNTVVELFESEIQASLNAPWMDSEYGLLQREGEDWVVARARIDGIQIAYSKLRPVQPVVADQDFLDGGFEDEDEPREEHPNVVAFTDPNLTNVMQSVRKRLGWVIGRSAMAPRSRSSRCQIVSLCPRRTSACRLRHRSSSQVLNSSQDANRGTHCPAGACHACCREESFGPVSGDSA